jgi:hypothetical protein
MNVVSNNCCTIYQICVQFYDINYNSLKRKISYLKRITKINLIGAKFLFLKKCQIKIVNLVTKN